MIYDVETESGAHYRIDTDKDMWFKYRPATESEDIYHYGLNRLVGMMLGSTLAFPSDDNDFIEVEAPEVGKHLFISGKGLHNWWVSTMIVNVEIVDSFKPQGLEF